MIATLAAISSVFKIFMTDRGRDAGVSASSSMCCGGGIDGAIGVGTGGSVGASGGAWIGNSGRSLGAFLNGHFSHFDGLRPGDFGTFTGVSR